MGTQQEIDRMPRLVYSCLLCVTSVFAP
jgi:hypothetical protein